jgi:aspartyl-tRNA(Asn)/glutamyl-tRNA(Gln) amidotransferase subunit C
MSLTRPQVEKVSLLARLRLSADELERMTSQLAAIVGYVEQLSELNTDAIEPMSHPLEVFNVFRDDEPWASLPREAMLANAPHADGEYYLVPAVLGE